mgnify:CR=1 FL=1|tara:strand:+ start:371 stop:1252 length:882 start_codon:yes stop_codon:yes gene_type:complete
MFKRQITLLALIEAFGGQLKSRDFQKYLFLFTEKCEQEKSYEFVPYKYGCFSFQSYADRRKLIREGHLIESDDWILAKEGYLEKLNKENAKKILLFQEHYRMLSGDNLVKEVYRDYPYFAVNSEIADRLMLPSELEKIKSERPSDNTYSFFTIGYEGQSFENYLNRLIKNNISLLCDVRRNPLSRKYGFSKSTLSDNLEKLGIKYIHFPELGILSQKRKEVKSQRDYDDLFDEYEKTTLQNNKEFLYKLQDLMNEHRRIAITCFEAKACQCHRGRVAKHLSKLTGWDFPIEHI